jgi:thiol-disulfide isomerase/thioredoxin
MGGTLMQSLVHFLHPHFVTNILLGVIFYILKTCPPVCELLFDDCQLEMREWELLTFLGCVIVMKNRKSPSYTMYLETACMFAKMLSTFLFLRQSPLYGSLYIIACLLHLVFLPEPVYKGPDYVTFFRGPNLEHEIERDKRINWLIEFYTPWAPTCVSFSSAFSELSAKYNLDNLKFGKIDVGRFPEVSKKFQIDTSAWSKQLPTVILFQGGKETRRRPMIDSKGKVVGLKFIFCKETVEREFELPTLHHDCKQFPLHKNKGDKKKEQEDKSKGDKKKEQEDRNKETVKDKDSLRKDDVSSTTEEDKKTQ